MENPDRGFVSSDHFEQLNRALDVLGEFRSSFSYPLGKVNMGLRAMAKAEMGDARPVVAQRLKRMDRILGKLVRMPDTKVARMEDIGGCRAVFPDPGVLAAVQRRMERVGGMWSGRATTRNSRKAAVTVRCT
jgi:putative GTP pyrophosphokinase